MRFTLLQKKIPAVLCYAYYDNVIKLFDPLFHRHFLFLLNFVKLAAPAINLRAQTALASGLVGRVRDIESWRPVTWCSGLCLNKVAFELRDMRSLFQSV